jgi:hypothetical protein
MSSLQTTGADATDDGRATMAEPTDESATKDTDLNRAVRKFLTKYEIPEGAEVEVRILVTNVSNNPIHEYRVVQA